MTALPAPPLTAPPPARAERRHLTPRRLFDLPAGLLVAHVVLGLLFARSNALSTIHAFASVILALTWALFSPSLERVVVGAGYVAMCDVLWRGTGALFFAEGAKYVVAGTLVVAMVRFVPGWQRTALPLTYVAMLLPSALLTIEAGGLGGARENISANLSGPVALAASAMLFSNVRCSWHDLRHLFLVMLAPLVASASATAYVLSTQEVVFNPTESVTVEDPRALGGAFSGLFGPNQVAAVLGLGALLCLLLLLHERRPGARVVELALGLSLLGASVLTFSRGGAFNFVVGGVVAMVLQVARSGARALAVLCVMILAGVLLFSRLDTFTGGALDQRFSERTTTNRTDIARSDLDIWSEHRLVGVGPGVSQDLRRGDLEGDAPHTEFTRELAEHGLLGLVALGCLALLAGRAVINAPTSWSRTVSITLLLWSLAAMGNSAMRIAATAFVFGLAMVRITPDGGLRSERRST